VIIVNYVALVWGSIMILAGATILLVVRQIRKRRNGVISLSEFNNRLKNIDKKKP
jgi:hypothetical protein